MSQHINSAAAVEFATLPRKGSTDVGDLDPVSTGPLPNRQPTRAELEQTVRYFASDNTRLKVTAAAGFGIAAILLFLLVRR